MIWYTCQCTSLFYVIAAHQYIWCTVMHTVRFLKMNWSIRTKFLKVYAIQHKFSLLIQSLTKTCFANTLEACFSMHKELKLVLIDDSLKGSSRVWAEWNVVLHSKSSTSIPHFIWTFRPFSSMERQPGKFMMWCKVHVFQQCLHTWNWIVCSVAHSENSIHAFIHSQARWRGSSPLSSRVWWLSLTKTFTALITIWLRLVFDFLLEWKCISISQFL